MSNLNFLWIDDDVLRDFLQASPAEVAAGDVATPFGYSPDEPVLAYHQRLRAAGGQQTFFYCRKGVYSLVRDVTESEKAQHAWRYSQVVVVRAVDCTEYGKGPILVLDHKLARVQAGDWSWTWNKSLAEGFFPGYFLFDEEIKPCTDVTRFYTDEQRKVYGL